MATNSAALQPFNSSYSKKEFKISTTEKWAIVASVVGIIVGSIIVSLGLLHIFGATGSWGYIGSVSGGGLLSVISMIALVKLVMHCRRSPEERVPGFLEEIDKSFFEEKSQARAKEVFAYEMDELLKAHVEFPTPGGPIDETIEGELLEDVFQVSISMGIERDIPRWSKDPVRVHVPEAASQTNCAEAKSVYTPPIGGAMEHSAGDPTQGPKAQRTNPVLFELVTAFLTHLGFNMYEKVLPSAGGTFDVGGSMQHGYPRPHPGNLKQLAAEFKQNYFKAEYVCYQSLNRDWGGSYPVYLMLQSSIATGYSWSLDRGDPDQKPHIDTLEKYAALANYLALFRQGIKLAGDLHKPVVVHPTVVGGSAFGNDLDNIAWGFKLAALTLQHEMKAAGVTVQIEAFQGDRHKLGTTLAKKLNIKTAPRIE